MVLPSLHLQANFGGRSKNLAVHSFLWSLACLHGNRVEVMNSHQFQLSTHASPFQVLEAQQASDRKISWNYWDQWNETQRVKCQTRKNMLRISRVLFDCFFRLALAIHWDVFLFSHLLLFLLAVVGVVVANKAVLMLWVHSQFGAFTIMSRLICFLGCSIRGLSKKGVSEAPQKCEKKSLETQIFQKAATHPLWVSSSKTSCEARFSQPIAKPPRQTWFAGHPNGFSLVGLSNIRSVPRKHWKSFRETWAYQLPKVTICHPLFPCIPTGSYLGTAGKFSTLTTTSGWNCNKIYKKTNVTHLPKPVYLLRNHCI